MGEETPQPPADGALATRSYVKICPADYSKIGEYWAQCKTYTWIAKQYGCDDKTVADVIKKHILPAMQVNPARSVEAVLLKYDVLEARAWECILSNEPAETREQIQQVLAQAGPQGEAKREIIELFTKTLTKRPNNAVYFDIVLKILDARCKIEGYHAPKRVRFENQDHRVAGMTPDEVLNELVEKMLKRDDEVQMREALLRGETIDIFDAKLIEAPKNTNGHVDP